mgnify:CR=1 FL=1|tara:strand:+ start:128 stop:2107 length:1980 start_codon:yes stop_codon:yes gene_type:complete
MSYNNIKTANPAMLTLLGGGGGYGGYSGLNNILNAHEPNKTGFIDSLTGLFSGPDLSSSAPMKVIEQDGVPVQMNVMEQDEVPVKEDTSWWENRVKDFSSWAHWDSSKGNYIADAAALAGGLALAARGHRGGRALAMLGGGMGAGRLAKRYVPPYFHESQKAELERMGAGTNPQGRTARTEAVASKDDPTNWANWIKENPGKATIGAGLGSALLYNAAGGREGIQQKLEAMRNNPLATVGGLGSLGLLSKITYDAMNKEADDKSLLDTWVLDPLRGVVQGTPTLQANQAIEETSKNEGNVLSGTDNVIDGVGEYLPAVLGIGALGAAGYGGYRLYDHLREKNSSWYNPTTWFDYPAEGSYGRDYENVQSRPGDIGLARKAGIVGLTGLATAPVVGIAAGTAPALIELGGGLMRGNTASQIGSNMAKTFSRYGKAALIPGALAGVAAGALALSNLGKWRSKFPNTDEAVQNRIKEYNESHAKKGPVSRGVRSGVFRILGGGFDKENAHTPTHESKFTAEYNHNSLLEGKQKTELPDFLQKEIIDHRAKTAVSVDAMRRYERANLDSGPSAAGNVAAGGLISLLGGGLAAATGPGGLKSRLLRGTLGALPGVALGAMLEDQRQKKYEDLYNLDDAALKKRYTHNKKVMDSLGLDPFTMSNK